MTTQWMTTLMLAAGMVGCSATPAPQPSAPAHAVGADRDSHGCIPSAGYQWCPATDKCERPWELAKENGFEHSAEGFEQFCRKP